MLTPEQQAKVDEWGEKCYRYKHRWIGYLTKLYGETFIRESAFPTRIMCESAEQLYRQIGHFNRNRLKDAYISVNAYTASTSDKDRHQGVKPDYNTIIPTRHFSDFDYMTKRRKTNLTLEDALKDALDWFDRFTDPDREIRFSGSKGFAVEIKMIRPGYVLDLKAFNDRAESHNLPTLDVTTDRARVCRIPYSLHPGTLRQCIPIGRNWGLDRILHEAESYRPPPVVML